MDNAALTRFLGACNPAAPAPTNAYVARPRPFAGWLGQVLRSAEQPKVLLVGQTGVGKSTELARLVEALEGAYRVLRPPLDEVLDLGVAGWHDVLVAAALAIEPARTRAIAFRNVLRAAGEGLRGDDLPLPGADRGLVREHSTQAWDAAVAALNSNDRRPVLLALDGLEKLTLAAAERLFVEQRHLLQRIPFACVVTAPLAMSFEPWFGEVEGDLLAIARLRALSCGAGQPGREFLEALAARRGAADVMSPALIAQAVEWSGGLPRQFLQLLATSATQALQDGLLRVEAETFVRARRRVAERWQYQLESADFDALRRPDHERTRAERSRLLALGALLEYDQPDGGLTLAVNPLVADLLARPQARSA